MASAPGDEDAGHGGGWDNALLMVCGIVTAVPLMIHANGAKRLTLSTIAIMQYIAPTMIFLTAVFIFGEPFSGVKLVAFALIWTALVIYTLPMLATRVSPGRVNRGRVNRAD